jgi:hypothetical protein
MTLLQWQIVLEVVAVVLGLTRYSEKITFEFTVSHHSSSHNAICSAVMRGWLAEFSDRLVKGFGKSTQTFADTNILFAAAPDVG